MKQTTHRLSETVTYVRGVTVDHYQALSDQDGTKALCGRTGHPMYSPIPTITCKNCVKRFDALVAKEEAAKAEEASRVSAGGHCGTCGVYGPREVTRDDVLTWPTELRDPSNAEYPQGTCAICAAPILYVHTMWIGTDGREHCHGTDVPHAVALVRDEAQDALDAEQERTGVHEGCGMPLAVHCANCDVCPTDRERCGCGPEGAIGADELTTITIAPYDGPSVIRTVPKPTADDVARMADPVQWVRDTLALETLRLDEPPVDTGAVRWQGQRIRYAMRVANGRGEIGTDAHRGAYLATLERGYPKRKASKHPRNRKGN